MAHHRPDDASHASRLLTHPCGASHLQAATLFTPRGAPTAVDDEPGDLPVHTLTPLLDRPAHHRSNTSVGDTTHCLDERPIPPPEAPSTMTHAPPDTWPQSSHGRSAVWLVHHCRATTRPLAAQHRLLLTTRTAMDRSTARFCCHTQSLRILRGNPSCFGGCMCAHSSALSWYCAVRAAPAVRHHAAVLGYQPARAAQPESSAVASRSGRHTAAPLCHEHAASLTHWL